MIIYRNFVKLDADEFGFTINNTGQLSCENINDFALLLIRASLIHFNRNLRQRLSPPYEMDVMNILIL